MRPIDRRSPILCIALVATVSALAAAGEIDTTGADIRSGDAPSPGSVMLDANAPAAVPPVAPRRPFLGTIGGSAHSLLSMPRMRSGRGLPRLSVSRDLDGGVYRVARIDVPAGVEITFLADTEIWCDGPCVIGGSIRTSGGNLRIVTTGDLEILPDARIDANRGSLTLEARGDITAGAGSVLESHVFSDPGLTLRTYGTRTGRGDITLSGATLQRSPTMTLQANGGDVRLTGTFSALVGDVLLVEARDDVILADDAAIEATRADVRVRALGGTLSLQDRARIAITVGEVDLGARGDVTLSGAAYVRLTGGEILVRSFWGAVNVSPESESVPMRTTSGEITVAARESVRIHGGQSIGHTVGVTRLISDAGDVTVVGLGRLGSGQHNDLRIWACGSIACEETTVGGGGELALFAERGGIRVGESAVLRGASGELLAGGAIDIAGSVTYDGDASLTSIGDSINVLGGTVSSLGRGNGVGPSGSVRLVSFAGPLARIDATDAVVASGPANEVSGDVVLTIHDGAVTTPREGFLVPDRILATHRPRRPDRGLVRVRGILDAGTMGLEGGPAIVTVGGESYELEFVVDERGHVSAQTAGLRFDVKSNRRGGSRHRFRLRRSGDASGVLAARDRDELVLGVQTASFDLRCAATARRGRFRRGRGGDAIAGPGLVPNTLELRGAGVASLHLDVALPGLGDRPEVADPVRIAFGDDFRIDLPTGAFRPEGSDVYVADSPFPGIDRVRVDHRLRTVTLKATDVPEPPSDGEPGVAVVVDVAVGSVRATQRVRLSQQGRLLRY